MIRVHVLIFSVNVFMIFFYFEKVIRDKRNHIHIKFTYKLVLINFVVTSNLEVKLLSRFLFPENSTLHSYPVY